MHRLLYQLCYLLRTGCYHYCCHLSFGRQCDENAFRVALFGCLCIFLSELLNNRAIRLMMCPSDSALANEAAQLTIESNFLPRKIYPIANFVRVRPIFAYSSRNVRNEATKRNKFKQRAEKNGFAPSAERSPVNNS